MKAVIAIALGAALFVAPTLPEEAKPSREAGLSTHLQPERIGRALGQTGGFEVRPQHAVKERMLVTTPGSLMELLRTQPPEVQANGIWVVTTHPAAYEESELKKLDALAELCKSAKVPLFVARASELPNGWQRRN